jgi:site-specific DNA-methyltransferase (adenine-specific)
MKPLDGTFQQNAEKWGIGGINIDESRIGTEQTTTCISGGKGFGSNFRDDNWEPPIESYKIENKGRWPANIIFDEISAELLDQQTGILKSPGSGIRRPNAKNSSDEIIPNSYLPPDSGGASRFFYCAKASRAERQGSIHPTMKPIALMKYVIKLLAPPNNPTLLDPFAGSGSTLIAAAELGINAIGIEKEKEYCDIAENRLKHVN